MYYNYLKVVQTVKGKLNFTLKQGRSEAETVSQAEYGRYSTIL